MPRRTLHRRRNRAISILEFVIILPIFLFLITFMVDMARVLMVTNAMQEATYRSARTSAVAGGANIAAGGGTSVARDAFFRAIEETPGGSSAEDVTLVVRTGGVCSVAGDNSFVTVESNYTVNLLTPGLGGLLGLAGGNASLVNNQYNLRAVSVSKCEVVGAP